MSDESTSGDASAEVERIRERSESLMRERFVSAPEAALDLVTLLAALDRVTEERDAYKRAKAENDERFMLERDQARAERDALAARLPSPESVTRARLVAAEIVDLQMDEARYFVSAHGERTATGMASAMAAHIRDRARTHSGTHDEGGDVDERELLWCAARVDGCTTLGELEALVARWREVA